MKKLTDKEIEAIADEEMKKITSYDKAYNTRYGIILGIKLFQNRITKGE